MDRRFKGVPRLSGLRHFDDGVSVLSMETGDEAKAMEKVFVPLMAGTRPAEVVGAARCLMDFLYRAHRPQLDENDLAALESDWQEFHDYKDIFETAGLLNTARMFNGIPKIHMLRHYGNSIRELGTTDGYSTETPERLHIEYVKVAYRVSKGPDQIPQMARWLQRREAMAMLRHRLERQGVVARRKLGWRRDGSVEDLGVEEAEVEGVEAINGGDEEVVCEVGGIGVGVDPGDAGAHNAGRNNDCGGVYQPAKLSLVMAKRPPQPKVPGSELQEEYHAVDFIQKLREFLRQHAPHIYVNIDELTDFEVWTRFRLIHEPLPFAPLLGPKIDRIRAYPGPPSNSRQSVHNRAFDTVLLNAFPNRNGLHRKLSMYI